MSHVLNEEGSVEFQETVEFLCSVPDLVIALDLEGVDLGRDGSIEIVSIATNELKESPDEPSTVLLLDVQDLGKEDSLICSLRQLLEHAECVIHDCRQDCDALYHILGIEIASVFDTAAAHSVFSRGARSPNLNTVLEANGLRPNFARIGINYTKYHNYWRTRPVTDEMVAHASGDVAQLLELYDLQLSKADKNGLLEQIKQESNRRKDLLRLMHTEWVWCAMPMGKFIGTRGCNMHAHEQATKCFFYGRGAQRQRQSGFLVYYPDNKSLQYAKLELGHTVPARKFK